MFKTLKIVFSALAALSFQQAVAEINISESFTTTQRQTLVQAIEQVQKYAPKKFLDLIYTTDVQIDLLQGSLKSSEQEAASAVGSKVLVNPQILDLNYFETNIKNKRSRHKDLQTFIAATLVHEVSHILDKKNLSIEDHNLFEENCRPTGDQILDSVTAYTCNVLKQKNGFYSYNSSYVTAAGWKYDLGFTRLNIKEQTSPDVYEYKNLRESFAVNMEYFILDPSYSCKKPATNNALKQFFGEPQRQQKDCSNDIGLAYSTSSGAPYTFKLAQVQSISYFFASQGEGMASKYGHAMLYLTVCPDGKDPATANCDNDLEAHVVVSPAALIYKNMSALDGMNGKYDMTYFVVPATKVIRDYSMVELRDLEKYPLKLNAKELGSSLFDFIWNFTEKYYFLSNNCAHGIMNVINSVYNLHTISGSSFSPLDLRELLISKGLIDAKPQRVFAADLARKKIKNRVLQATQSNWETLSNLSVEKRQQLYERAIAAKQVSWGDLVQVEYAIVQAKQENISVRMNMFIVEKKQMKDSDLKDTAKKLSAIGELINNDSYGIPQYDFVKSNIDLLLKEKFMTEEKQNLIAEFKKLHAKELADYDAANLYYRKLLELSLKAIDE